MGAVADNQTHAAPYPAEGSVEAIEFRDRLREIHRVVPDCYQREWNGDLRTLADMFQVEKMSHIKDDDLPLARRWLVSRCRFYGLGTMF